MKLLLVGVFFTILSNAHGNSPYVKKTPFNITGKWFLPNPTSPVFYLHFRDRISWIEADAVCQFHHSQLVTVNTATQFEDVRSYLIKLYYEEPIWIGLCRIVTQGPFKWTNDSVLSTNEYWKETPVKDEKLCVISSPSDNYRWTARQCNGPDVASFICEMPIPKWVQKSACLDSLNPSITVTFHPEKSMIKAGRVCQNTDVKYIECHDPQGKADKVIENGKMIKEHLNCDPVSQFKGENATQRVTAKTNIITSSSIDTAVLNTSKPLYTMTPTTTAESFTRISISTSALNTLKTTDFNVSSDNEFFNKNVVILETVSETSTITLPQEMSFAEEPIKTSKPLAANASTGGPPPRYNVTASLTASKSLAERANAVSPAAAAKPTIDSTIGGGAPQQPQQPLRNATTSAFLVLSTASSLLANSTPPEESHEIFNNDEDRETFQQSGAAPKKSPKMEALENVANSPKGIVSKSSESEEEVTLGDRTYNIEGTFDSNDFANAAQPISVYKKIDLNPLENATEQTSLAPSESSAVRLSDPYPAATSVSSPFSTNLSTTISSTSAFAEEQAATVPNNDDDDVDDDDDKNNNNNNNSSSSSNNNSSSSNDKNSASNESTTTSGNENFGVASNQTAANPQTSPLPQKKPSPLLSAAQEAPNRKRRAGKSDRHSSYPYFLGRILG